MILKPFSITERVFAFLMKKILLISLSYVASGFVLARCNASSVVCWPSGDTFISQQSKYSSPQGGNTVFLCGASGESFPNSVSRVLIKFDLSAVPTNAVVTNVVLTMRVSEIAPTTNIVRHYLHRALVPWSETSATWLNYSSGQPWTTPGGASSSDYSSTPSSSQLVNAVGVYVFPTTTDLISDVQSWVNLPGNNCGWFVISGSQDIPNSIRKYYSRESGTNKPYLNVDYFVQAIPPRLEGYTVSSGNFCFMFGAEADRSYVVEYTEDASSVTWNLLTNIPQMPTAEMIYVADPLVVSNRFYRVKTP